MSKVAGDFDYESGGVDYGRRRRTDPRIAALVHAALGGSRTVINVGAGAGSYEPADRDVTAVELSAAMRAQRHTPAIDAVAEDLPFADDTFDAGMAMMIVHQWPDLARGLAELRRVVRGPVVILTFDGDTFDRFWGFDYLPELRAAEAARFPAIARIRALLGGTSTVQEVRAGQRGVGPPVRAVAVTTGIPRFAADRHRLALTDRGPETTEPPPLVDERWRFVIPVRLDSEAQAGR